MGGPCEKSSAAFIVLLLFTIGPKPVAKAQFPNNFLENEAGIAAYFSFPGTTNLKSNMLHNLFRTVSIETQAYLVGFVPVDGFEDYPIRDVKVFIHNDGWVVAYLTNNTPTAGMFYQGTMDTILERTLERVASAIEATSYTIYFHSFNHPDADKMMMVRLTSSSSPRTTDFRLPGENTFYDRSWMVSAWALFSGGRFELDGREVASVNAGINTQTISGQDLVTDAKHVVRFTGWGSGADLFLAFLFSGETPVIFNGADDIRLVPMPTLPVDLVKASANVPFYLDIYLPLVVR